MSDKSGIQRTDATWPAFTVMEFTEGNGRHRRRVYQRTVLDKPGQRERRAKRLVGLAWCRGCAEWLPTASVRDGVCREHANAEYRARYAADGEAIRQRIHARKRGIDPLHPTGVEYLTEQFEGLCAYCPEIATTWDHVVPVAHGGRTAPGNIVPACAPCNSSKKTSEVFSWLARTGRPVKFDLLDVIALEMAA